VGLWQSLWVTLAALATLLDHGSAVAQLAPAQIVMLEGRGDRRDTAEAAWVPAAVNQTAGPGAFVRTLANSQMGLLMADRTQIRLNQNSQLQIKTSADAAATAVRLNSGRAWSQARPQTVSTDSAAAKPKLTMETASATMSIRGTDWEVEILPNGQTQLVVLSGTVEMANELGAISVGKGEAAVAEVGKAPTKLLLVRPQSRVQWVSSWKPDPKRWAGADAARFGAALRYLESGDYAAASGELAPLSAQDPIAAILWADLLLQQGELQRAIDALAPHAGAGKGEPRAGALLAAALVRNDQADAAQTLLASALKQHPGQADLLLAQGELAIVQGQANQARQAFGAVVSTQPTQAQAWYGLGLIESERENIRAARRLLAQALVHDPLLSKASAELAAAETLAGDTGAAKRLLDDLLAREPANYVALTALGISQLQSGQTREALANFMKAGLIEPRYARAWLYSGIAFYQLGERQRAIEAFARAAELDPRDPAPHQIESVVHEDALQYGQAVQSARRAQQNMPYLKSLNQLASDQNGSANLSTSLANFGMEEWASYYAGQAYSPYWGGSHLFLADRQTGQFNKNSELFKGFLTEPTAFGASNRQSTLVSTPGHYGRVDTFVERDDWRQAGLVGSVNGLSVQPVPLAYFASLDLAAANSVADPSRAHGHNLILGLGSKPRYDLGLFGFATDADIRGTVHTPGLPNDPIHLSNQGLDLGMNFKFAPDNQVWLKAGSNRQRAQMSGALVSQATVDMLRALHQAPSILATGSLEAFESAITTNDLQFRHAFTRDTTLWTWGLEHSRLNRSGSLVEAFPGLSGNRVIPVIFAAGQESRARITDAYVSAKYQRAGEFDIQWDLASQHGKTTILDQRLSGFVFDSSGLTDARLLDNTTVFDYAELNPRLGLQWQLGPLQSLRWVSQRWRRPASAGSLSPIDTVGITLNDRLLSAGGLYRRTRLQFDGELGSNSFVQAFVDQERVDNPRSPYPSPVAGFELSQLENLRNRTEVFTARSDLEETPEFARGQVASLGLSLNHMLGSSQTVALRYLARQTRQQGNNEGLKIPYIPRHYAQVASQWALTGGWLLGSSATFRSERFRDDTNLERIAAGWAFGLTAYWESASKHSSLQAILDNLLVHKQAGNKPDPHVVLRYSYRF
jgi:Flp pilus assembly protein TadD